MPQYTNYEYGRLTPADYTTGVLTVGYFPDSDDACTDFYVVSQLPSVKASFYWNHYTWISYYFTTRHPDLACLPSMFVKQGERS